MPDQAQGLRELVGKKQGIRVVSVTSGKGGVGKSSFSVNCAVALQRLGVRTLLIDADFGLANVDVMMGMTTKYDISHFLRGERNLGDIIQTGHEGIQFISGGSGVSDLLNIGEDQLADLLASLLSPSLRTEFIIIDTGAGINENVIRIILESSETIVVTTTEPTAILDAYALVKTIVKRGKDHPIGVIVNKCQNKKEAIRIQEGFIDVVGKHLGKNINPLGMIMYDSEVSASIKKQIPISVSMPNGTTSREISNIARTMLDMTEEGKRDNKLSRIFSKLLASK